MQTVRPWKRFLQANQQTLQTAARLGQKFGKWPTEALRLDLWSWNLNVAAANFAVPQPDGANQIDE